MIQRKRGKIQIGEQYGDITCIDIGIDKETGEPRYTWRCKCGVEKVTRRRSACLMICKHGQTNEKSDYCPKDESKYTLPENSPCRNCGRNKDNNCVKYVSCVEWRSWFSREWNAIRVAGKALRAAKKQKEYLRRKERG